MRNSRPLPLSATILGDEETGETDAFGDPIVEETVVAEGVDCRIEDSSTLERTDAGDRVQRPATLSFHASAADVLEEGRTVEIDDGTGTVYEIRGLDRKRDIRGRVVGINADIERAD